MPISFLSPSRCVLMIGDEALCIYNLTINAVKLIGEVPWQSEDFDETVIGLLQRQARGKSVLILNDMTDQHFKGGQRLPRVGPFDKQSVVRRKLQVAFPNYPIRGALQIKQARDKGAGGSRESGASGGDLYLFAAVPMSEPVQKTIDVVRKSMASIAGFYLLPVEASDMVHALARKVAGRKGKTARWVVFIGQQRGHGLRQVIIRDGNLAMTRMTPLSDSDAGTPEAWARDVHQEFKATISYLSRFGFTPEEGVDVIVIGSREGGAALEKMIDIPCHYVHMTALEAARSIDLKIGMQAEPALADSLYAGWVGRKARFSLPMQAPELEKIHKPRQVTAALVLLLLLGGGWQAWQTTNTFGLVSGLRQENRQQSALLASAQEENRAEVESMKVLGFDVRLVQGAIGAFDAFEKDRMRPLVLTTKIAQSLGDQLRADELILNYIPGVAGGYDPSTGVNLDPVPAQAEASVKLSFPPEVELEIATREVESFQRRLIENMPGYTVTIEKKIAGFDYADTLSGSAGRTAKEISEEDRVAVLKIRGAVQ